MRHPFRSRTSRGGLIGGIPDVMILADAVEERSVVALKDRKFIRLAEHQLRSSKLLEVSLKPGRHCRVKIVECPLEV